MPWSEPNGIRSKFPLNSRRVYKAPVPYLAQKCILSLVVPLKVVTGAKNAA